MGLLLTFLIAAGLLTVLGTLATIHGMTHPSRQTLASALAAGWPTTPVEAGLEGEAVSFTLADGAMTEGFLIHGQRCDGPVLIWLHGFGSSRFGALQSAALFVPWVRGIVCFDQRAHGACKARSFHFGQLEVDDVLTVADQLPPVWRHAEKLLLGKSMGASLAIETAWRMSLQQTPHPAMNICGLMLEGAFLDLSQPVHRYFQRHRYPCYPIVSLAMTWLKWRCPVLRHDRLAQVEKLACPLLILHGEHDDTANPEHARKLAAHAARATFVLIPDARHHALADAAPALYRQAIKTFLKAVQAPQA